MPQLVSKEQARVGFRIAAYGLLAASILLLGNSIARVTPTEWRVPIDNYGYTGVSALSAAIVFGRVALVRGNRAGWALFATGLGLLCAGDFYYTTQVTVQDNPPFPSFADVLYLMGYPILAAGLAVLLWNRLRHARLSLWLDATIGILAIVMVITGLLLGAITGTTGTTLQQLVSLAYPLADLVLLSMIAAVIALTGARLDRMLVVTVLAIGSICVADVIFFYETAMGTWSDWSPIALLWPLGGALFAVAAWTRAPEGQTTPVVGMRSLVLPSIFTLTILAYLLTDPPRLAEALGAVALLVLVVRMAVGAHEKVQLVNQLGLDPLTGLGNRGSLSADLSRAIAFDRPHTLALADLDGFKLYNDAFGHPAGDAMLKRLSHALSNAVPSASAYRIGGDEFCVLIPGEVSEEDRSHAAIVEALSERGEGFNVGVSLGYATLPFESSDPEELVQIADQRMYAAKEDCRSSRQMQDAFAVLINAQREREPALGEHVVGVAQLADRVGERMGLLPGEVAMLVRAAELHDIGKIAIPDAILNKPSALDDEEWEFMRQHTILGERILRSADSLAPVGRIVRFSHERYDGKGYPDGLEGEQIPLASRIVFACDAFHAMTSERPYSKPKTREEALAELRRCAGSQFDPEVVEIIGQLLGDEAAEHAAVRRPVRALLSAWTG